MPKKYWTAEETELFVREYPTTNTAELAKRMGRTDRQLYSKADNLSLKKTAAFKAELAAAAIERGRCNQSRFKPGHTTWNKGKKGLQLSPHTQFKAGRPASDAHNYRPIGSTRINHDGYLERKVSDDPAMMPARRWIGVHRLVWEAAHGPIPDGHVVVFRQGARSTTEADITLDKVELITREELMHRNSLHRLPPELCKTYQLIGAVRRQINRKKGQPA